MIHTIEVPSNTIVYKEIVCHFFNGKVRMKSECFLTYFMLNVFSLTLCWMFSHLLYVECFLTYFMLNVFSLTLCWMFSNLLYVDCFLTYFMFGKRSDTIPLKSFKSSTRNFGTFTSRMARKAISSCRRRIQTLQYANCVLYIGFWHNKMVW